MELVFQTIAEPARIVTTLDTRAEEGGHGERKNEPATAYISVEGHYVVVNDSSGEVIALSDRTDPEWKSRFRV